MNDQPLECPICDSQQLEATTWSMVTEHRGKSLTVEGLEKYQCRSCGADPVFEWQLRRNDRRIANARRAADGLLTCDEVKALRERLGVSQQQAGVLFGGGPMAFSKYERGVVGQSVAMDRLLRLVADFPLLLGRLADYAGTAEWKTQVPAPVARPAQAARGIAAQGRVVSMQDYRQRAA